MNLVPIQITIQAANASDLRALVADLAGTLIGIAAADIPAETTVSTVENKQRTVEEMAYDVTKGLRDAILVEKEAGATQAEDIPSDVALRELAAEKAKSAGKAPVKALLDKYGAASITAVPQESRIAFKKELEAL